MSSRVITHASSIFVTMGILQYSFQNVHQRYHFFIRSKLLFFIYIIIGGICSIVVNYLADVLPSSHRLRLPKCNNCHKPFPIFQYVLARRCPHCGSAPSLRSRVVLISGPLIGLLLYFFPTSIFTFWETLPLFIYLGVVLVIDIEHRMVLIETSIVGLILCVIYGLSLQGFRVTLLGALGGFGIMLLFYLSGVVFNLVMGKIRHRKITEVAFGFGDVSLGTILGALVGWPAVVGLILIAIIIFGVFSLFYVIGLFLTKRYQAFTSALPFAPSLILSLVILLYL